MVGSGLGRKGAGVRWRTAGKIATGWLFTLPAAAIIGGLAAALTHLGSVGVWIVLITGLAAMLTIFLISLRNSVTHENAMRGVEVSSAAVHIPTKKERRSAARALRREAREAHEHAKAAAAKAKSEARKARRAARAATHAHRVARKAAAAELREVRRAQDREESARLSFIAAVDSQAAAEESDVAAREAERAAKEASKGHDVAEAKQGK